MRLPKKVTIPMRDGLSIEHPFAAGIDIGDTEIAVAVRSGNGQYEVSTFGTSTSDLNQIIAYLKEWEVTTAAMESTGVYYVPLYLLLEQAGVTPFLVNARHVKNVTGRKQDDTDAVWLQKLHSCGLLQKSFQPAGEDRILREYVRHRRNLVRISSDAVRRMQKALELMNIKVHTVISDILGKTGINIIKAIIGGERNAEDLAELADGRVKAPLSILVKSLEAIWREDQIFALKQAYETYCFHEKQIAECDKQINSQLQKQVTKINLPTLPQGCKCPKKKKQIAKKNKYGFDVRAELQKLTGVDLCQIPSISEITAIEVVAEIGTDMTVWKNDKQFTSWLNLCPNTKISGGKVLSSKIMKKKNHAGQALRMAAITLSRNKGSLGNYYRKMKGRLGGRGAAVATAHKLAKIIYAMLRGKVAYDETVYNTQLQKATQKKIDYYERKIKQLKNAA